MLLLLLVFSKACLSKWCWLKSVSIRRDQQTYHRLLALKKAELWVVIKLVKDKSHSHFTTGGLCQFVRLGFKPPWGSHRNHQAYHRIFCLEENTTMSRHWTRERQSRLLYNCPFTDNLFVLASNPLEADYQTFFFFSIIFPVINLPLWRKDEVFSYE
jgi:hypothetical protein